MLLRAVIREDMSMQMADMLVRDIQDAVAWLDTHVVLSTKQVTALTQQFKMQRMPSAIYQVCLLMIMEDNAERQCSLSIDETSGRMLNFVKVVVTKNPDVV